MLKKIFAYMQGRHTAFAAFFALVGVLLQWFHRLDATFVAYMTSLMGMVLGHSIQENHFGGDRKGDSDATVSQPKQPPPV
jgi:hypothetical protein